VKKRTIFFLLAASGLLACNVSVDTTPKPDTPIPNEDADPLPGEDGSIPDAGSDAPMSDAFPPGETHSDGIKNAGETGVDCGGLAFVQCPIGQSCVQRSDCATHACGYQGICLPADQKSCLNHLGGDTCGRGEVGESGTAHESCCRSLPVPGYNDPNHPGKITYLDKYEVTAGRIRAFIADITQQMSNKPDIKSWINFNKPTYWNSNWNNYLPSDYEGGSITIPRLLLGDPRHDGQTQEQAGPGVILPPTNDQNVSVGLNHQFGGQVFADLHGNNCGTYTTAYGFPTYYYPANVQTKNGEVPRADALDSSGKVIPAQEFLDVKSMNCVTNAMLAAFCHWDGGQLATSEVVDFVTASPNRPNSVSGCGSQYDNHGALLGDILDGTVQSGGRCADVNVINATFDAGDVLPTIGSFLNQHNYHYPNLGASNSDKSWQIAAPGRVVADRVSVGAEVWMDLAGNLSETTLDLSNGLFALKGRGIGYGSSRSDLNVQYMPGETILRVQRPEAKSALVGGRCMRFK